MGLGSAGQSGEPHPPADHRTGITAMADERARVQKRTMIVLVSAQVIGGLGIGIALAVGTLVARALSGSDALAGASVTMVTLGAAIVAIPLARRAALHGRRAALSLGWLIAALGALATVGALVVHLFPLMLLGFALFGAATASHLQSRYAATDLAEPSAAARSLSVVVWATTIGAVIGPNLSAPTTSLAKALGLPALAGPFIVSTIGFAACAGLLMGWLRPDPLLSAQALSDPEGDLALDRRSARGVDGRPKAAPTGRSRSREGWAAIRASQEARVALVVIVVVQAVMVAVMAMTPVTLVHHGASLTIVGFTISLHVAGMYALSPVFGWMADRWGRRPVMLLGMGLLLAAVALAGTSGARATALVAGLVLLGLGWSAGMVAGSTSIAESVPIGHRPAAQGLADALMGLAGASAAALSGVALAVVGFAGLNVLAGLLTIPAIVAVLRLRAEVAEYVEG